MGETDDQLTDAQLLLLGLVAEMPRHGYQLEQEIDARGMREWTQIGFSSVYFVLGKLEKMGLVRSAKPEGPKARKTFEVTTAGQGVLKRQAFAAVSNHRPTYSSLLLGMLHWPTLEKAEALEALRTRAASVGEERRRLEQTRARTQPLPDYIDVLFDFSIGQLNAEAEWVDRTLDYMETKPWLEEA